MRLFGKLVLGFIVLGFIGNTLKTDRESSPTVSVAQVSAPAPKANPIKLSPTS